MSPQIDPPGMRRITDIPRVREVDQWIIEGRGFIDHIAVLANPHKMGRDVIVVREIRQVQECPTLYQQFPGWRAFARALQGGTE